MPSSLRSVNVMDAAERPGFAMANPKLRPEDGRGETLSAPRREMVWG